MQDFEKDLIKEYYVLMNKTNKIKNNDNYKQVVKKRIYFIRKINKMNRLQNQRKRNRN